MSATLQLPIEILPLGSSGNTSQFGSLRSATSGDSGSQQPFAAMLQSMSATPYVNASPAANPSNITDSKNGSDTQGKTASANNANYYAGLISLFLSMSKGSDGAARSLSGYHVFRKISFEFDSVSRDRTAKTGVLRQTPSPDSGNAAADGKSTSGLLAKIEKEISALLGGGLVPAAANAPSLSNGSTSGGPVHTGEQGNSTSLGKILTDSATQSDLHKLASALSDNSAESSSSAILQELLSRAQKVEPDSNGSSHQSVADLSKVSEGVQGLSMNQLAETISRNLQSSGSAGEKASAQGEVVQAANSRIAANGMTNGSSRNAGSASSFTSGDLKRLMSEISGNSSDKSISVSTERLSAEMQNARLGSSGTVLQVLKSPGTGSDSAISSLKSGVQGEYGKVMQAQILPGTTGISGAASGTAHNSASAGSLQNLSAIETASSSITPKAANVSSGTGASATVKTEVVVAGSESQKVAVSLSQSKQDSSKSDGKLPDLTNSSVTDLYRNAPVGTNLGASFKEALSAASVTTNGPTEAKPNAFQVAQTILRGVNMMTEGRKTVVTLKLEPESLGSVALQVSSESGKISAQFDVKTPDARAFLEASIPQMKQMLQTNGISLSHLTVSLTGGESQSNHPQQQSRKQQSRFYAAAPADSEEALRTFGYNTMEMKI